MSLDSIASAKANLKHLVAALSDKSPSRANAQLSEDLWGLVWRLGREAEVELLRSLVSWLPSEGKGSETPQSVLLARLFAAHAVAKPRPGFLSVFCEAYEKAHSAKSRPPPAALARLLRLNPVQECLLALALSNAAAPELRKPALALLRRSLPELLRRSATQSGLEDAGLEALQLLLTAIQEDPDRLGVSPDLHAAFLSSIRTGFPGSQIPLILLPWLTEPSHESLGVDVDLMAVPLKSITGSLALQVQELGAALTRDVDDCAAQLRKIGVVDGGVTSTAVAHVIAMMIRPARFRGSSWSGDSSADVPEPVDWKVAVFVEASRKLLPSLDWDDVVTELDQPGFTVVDRAALVLLHSGLQPAFPSNAFPIHRLLSAAWSNKEGQLSWVVQILRNPDVFSVGEQQRSAPLDLLKQQPDEKKEILCWKSLELVECLLGLSEEPGLYKEVETLFVGPLQTCPDLLLLSLLHVPPPVRAMRHQLLGKLTELLFGPHPNALALLHCAWETTLLPQASMRSLVLAAMGQWYKKAQDDQTRLAKILDLAHEFKALSPLLASSQLYFALDLACLASRRDFLKLDKWLVDKIREYKEAFADVCIGYVRRRTSEKSPAPLPPDVVSAILLALQAVQHNLSAPLAAEVRSMLAQHPHVTGKGVIGSGQMGQGGATSDSARSAPGHMYELLNATNNSPASSTLSARLEGTKPELGFGEALGASEVVRNPFSAPTPTPFLKGTGSVSPARLGGIGGSGVGLSRMGGWGAGTRGSAPGPPPALDGASATSPSSAAVPDISQTFSEEVQEEANSYFQQIYTQPPQPCMTIGDFISILKQFRDADNAKQNEVFGCMLKNLFEEYRFFPEYPERELYTTALVYGSIIRENIISGMHMAYAMRGVMLAIKKESGSKMFWFGLVALDQFKARLKDYPRYSECVAALPHFESFPGHLVDFVRAGMKSEDPTAAVLRSETPVVPPALRGQLPAAAATVLPSVVVPRAGGAGARTSAPSLSQATNITTLVSATENSDAQVTPPSESIQEKVAFLFNNLSQANLVKKVADLWKPVLEESDELLPWLAQYLVMKRVSIEPNFHNLYANFVSEFPASTPFERMALEETYRNIRILLRSDKRQAASSFADRQLLKNLGHWLGMITLAKSKPILFQDLDIKSLLLEGYYKGQQELLFVVPFVAKILESCAKSLVFKVPNAWTMGILNLLGELHAEPDLKLNLKFEIEVLCKGLGPVELSSLKPGTLLKDTDRLESLMASGRQQLDDVRVLGKQMEGLSVGPSPIPASASSADMHQSASRSTLQSEEGSSANAAPPPPKFSYHDINVTSFSGLTPHLCINHQLELFQMNPPLKNLVRPSIEHAVRELITPVAERAIKVAMTTTEHVVKKDFALEADEGRMRAAAHHMVRSLTAGMAMITCREPLVATMQGYLKQAFFSSFRGANQDQQRVIEDAVVAIAEDNVELGQCFIVKSACEKAIPEIDKRLEHEYQIRRSAKMDNRRYCDPNTLTYQAERMPEPIRLKVGSVTPMQQEVYKEFSCNISGFKPTTADDLIVGFPSDVAKGAGQGEDQLEVYYQRLIRDMDTVIVGASNPSSPALSALRNMREGLAIAAQQPKDAVSATNLIQKLVEILLGSFKTQSLEPEQMTRLRDAFMVGMKLVCGIFGGPWVVKTVTKWVIECRQEFRFNLDAIDVLIRAQLLSLTEYDQLLAQTIADPMNFVAIHFVQRLIKLYFAEEAGSGLTQADLRATIEALSKVGGAYGGTGRAGDGSVQSVLEMIRSDEAEASGGTAGRGDLYGGDGARAMGGIGPGVLKSLARDSAGDEESTELQQKAEAILRDWLPMAYTATYVKEPSKAFSLIVQTMHQHGILRTDEMITRFFRLCTEMCVDLSYRLLNDPATIHHTQLVRGRCFYTLDAYVRLISILVKHSGDGAFATKINLLNKVLGVIAQTLIQDQQVRGTEFHQLPYHRLLIMLFWELTTPDALVDPINFQILTSFCNTLHMLQPRKVPGFAYAWLDMVGHRAFMGRMLLITPQQKAWPMYAQLLIDHLKFLAPFLRNIDLPKPIALMYKGTLRVLLVVLHDFPELLVEYGSLVVEVIPPNCVQLRNLVLSAYPRQMRLPDPFSPGLSVDSLPDMRLAPPGARDGVPLLESAGSLLSDLDDYLSNRQPVSFLSELPSKLLSSAASSSASSATRYNGPILNALVLYTAQAAIADMADTDQRPTPTSIAHTSYMDVFQSLALNLDTAGRYLFFNSIANQLRYPNSHTHYFSSLLLYLFQESNQEVIQEQITRILFERLVALRPHPWGLLITFIQLIKNPQYHFWDHDFVRCAPEIERLFESVAASCFKQQVDQLSAQPTSASRN